MTVLLTAGRPELQHQGGAVGAEDRDELVTAHRVGRGLDERAPLT